MSHRQAVISSPLLPLRRSIERPAPAERLRQDPWLLTASADVGGRTLAVLRREGAGRLVFMKT